MISSESNRETITALRNRFRAQNLTRPLRIRRYDEGDELSYDIRGVFPDTRARAKVAVERFVGGGYAGQVYRVRLIDIQAPEGGIPGLTAGGIYAMKILVPPSGFARLFRRFIYWLAFQGPFSAQVNPEAARAGALWQKLIRRAAARRLGTEKAVVDILATFVDDRLGSCGEISEWIDGRMWRFESDDDLDARRRWKVGQPGHGIGSPEYRAKKSFMARLVALMHDMGAHELARQYEWMTWKSQPNALKRRSSDSDPEAGNTAVDFRAGLALLPFLPMCPADFPLIARGIARGSLVQFDRGDITRLREYARIHAGDFEGMRPALDELERLDAAYRESLPDITHHHVRLLHDGGLWKSVLAASVRAWKITGKIDERTARRLSSRPGPTLPFYLLGGLPLLGGWLRKLFGHREYRRHIGAMLTSPAYFLRAGRARIAEAQIRWLRAGRVTPERALRISRSTLRYFAHLPLSLLPPGLHRFLSDRRSFVRSLDSIFVRPLRLYFRTAEREQWLRDMVSRGRENGMLDESEADKINSRIKEPFIQKYLKSLAVHICTVPVTQIVSVLVAVIYVRMHPELSWQEASVHAGLILGLFQVTPISPGSLVRGLYVTGLVLREKNFRDYNIAFFLSFFKYIGYLAFPIQMAYRYPDLARFMAGHWATEAVHMVPIFGERGALLEHGVFDLFYNFPLTIRRRMRRRRELREGISARFFHVPLLVLGGGFLLALIDRGYYMMTGAAPTLGRVWGMAIWIPLLAGALTAAGSGGSSLPRRIVFGVLEGAALGILYAAVNTWLAPVSAGLPHAALLGTAATKAMWNAFLFILLSLLGVLLFETRPLGRKSRSSSPARP